MCRLAPSIRPSCRRSEPHLPGRNRVQLPGRLGEREDHRCRCARRAGEGDGAGAQAAQARRSRPGRCYRPEVLEQRRLWGFMVQLYGVRSERNWGIGDFTDLRTLAEIAAGLGAGVIGVNPLHATQGSPYSPSSRHALNVLYIDVEAVPGFEKSEKLRRRLRALRDSELVDYEGVRRGEARSRWKAFSRKPSPKSSCRARGCAISRCSRRCARSSAAAGSPGRRSTRIRVPPQCQAFKKKHAKRVAFHAWLQATARAQLDAGAAPHAGARHAARALRRPRARRRSRRRGGVVGPGGLRGRGLVRRAAGRVQSARPGLGPAAVFAARAARQGLPAVHRAAARQHAGGRGAAHGPRHGAVAPVVDPAGREARARRLRQLSVPRAAGGARRREPPRALPGDRRGPRHRAGRAARRAQRGRRALLPAAAVREGREGRVRAAGGLPARRAGLRRARTTCRPGAATGKRATSSCARSSA